MVNRTACLGGALTVALLCSCSTTKPKGDQIVVSVRDQRLVLMDDGVPVRSYPVSTSKYGLGSTPRSHRTPVGKMYVHQKIGGGARSGTVFKSRRPTGEVIRPNAPGRDPIVSRILWLEGVERSNANTKERMIYIHGTPEERNIGRPASYGCIRMTSRDVIDLYDRVNPGTGVYIKTSPLRVAEIPSTERMLLAAARRRDQPSVSPPRVIQTPIPEVLAAAAPSRQARQARPASRPAARPPAVSAPRPPVFQQQQNAPIRRRGAFTKMPGTTAATSNGKPLQAHSAARVAVR